MTGDLRLAVRSLLRTPVFSLGAIVPLALGFCLTAATFAVLNAYLIRSLPYPAAERVYHLMYAPPGPWEPKGLSGLDWASLGDVVEFPMQSAAETFYLTDTGGAALRGRRVTYGILAGLDTRLPAGRWLTPDDFRGGPEPAALIAFAVWRDRFGSDPAAIGRVVSTETENGRLERYRIAGVLPAGFFVGGDSAQPIDVVVPMDASPRRYYLVRLQPDVAPAVAERRITQTVRQIATDLPADWTGAHLESARERYAGQLRPILVGVTAAASLLLFIVLTNVAVLIVLRTARRQNEIALRLALGSSLGQLVRLLAADAVAISVTATAIGLLLTRFALALLAPLIETQLNRSAAAGAGTIAVDATVVTVVAVVGAASALALTFLPVLLLRSRRLAHVLRRTGTTITDGLGMKKLRVTLLVVEVSATLVLLAGCGLLVRSVITMLRTDVGFESRHLSRSRVALRAPDYGDPPQFSRFFDAFVRQAEEAGTPVVFASWPPFAEFSERAIEVDGRSGHVLNAGSVTVGARYLAALGIALRTGRDITAQDVATAAPVAVISESLATRLWPDGNIIGRQIRQVTVTAGGPEPPGPWQTVVGVAADVRQRYGDPNVSDIYSPWQPQGRFGSFYIRSDRPLADLTAALRTTAAAIDGHAILLPLRAVDDENRELAGTSFLALILSGFAGAAALIAVLGIYAVTAYAVQQREREMAIRVALGASGSTVQKLFLRESALVMAAGLAIGLAGSVAAARLLAQLVFAVRPFDAPAQAGAAVLMAVAGLAAAWWPARRASRVNPAVALKES